jgi:hypothetical protein
MQVLTATRAAPGRANEDLVIAAESFTIVLDGVTQPPDLVTGCRHNAIWLVERLGDLLAELLGRTGRQPLDEVLAEAIRRLGTAHGPACDLTNPESPSATVAIIRERDDLLDCLVLCDSTVVLDHGDRCVSLTDDRTARLPAYDRETVGRLRNAPGGFWVASTRPEAAHQALTATVPLASIRQALVCTDGVSRLVETFGSTWTDVLALANGTGPQSVIDAVREAERAGIPSTPRPMKQHDDATLALCHFGPSMIAQYATEL